MTAVGIVQPLTDDMRPTMVARMMPAVGAGSVFLSHGNDVGSWLVIQYFKQSICRTLKSWSLTECVVSVAGPGGVAMAALAVGGA